MCTLTEDRERAVKMTAKRTKYDLATKCAPTVNIYFSEETPVLNFAERKFVSSGRGALPHYPSRFLSGRWCGSFEQSHKFLRCVPWSNCYQWRRYLNAERD
jgi:hypothetical protein